MRLLQYWKASTLRLGAAVEDLVIDLNRGSRALAVSQRGPRKNGVLPADMLTFLQAGQDGMRRAREVIRFALQVYKQEGVIRDFLFPREKVRLGPPITNPQKIVCVGHNYRDHCKEQNAPIPRIPLIFAKFPTAIIGHNDTVVAPAITASVDFEAELAFVIGAPARNVPEKRGMEYVAGYMCLNDVSARDILSGDGQWVRGKSLDTFAPIGPVLVTRDEIEDPHKLKIGLTLNGEVMQQSSTRNLIFKVPYLVAFLSAGMTLLPGDIITTGTPPGVGVHRKPPRLLRDGDVMEVRIEKIGVLRNPVAIGRS